MFGSKGKELLLELKRSDGKNTGGGLGNVNRTRAALLSAMCSPHRS